MYKEDSPCFCLPLNSRSYLPASPKTHHDTPTHHSYHFGLKDAENQGMSLEERNTAESIQYACVWNNSTVQGRDIALSSFDHLTSSNVIMEISCWSIHGYSCAGLIRVGYCITLRIIWLLLYIIQTMDLVCVIIRSFFLNGSMNLKAGFWTLTQQDGCATFYGAFGHTKI